MAIYLTLYVHIIYNETKMGFFDCKFKILNFFSLLLQPLQYDQRFLGIFLNWCGSLMDMALDSKTKGPEFNPHWRNILQLNTAILIVIIVEHGSKNCLLNSQNTKECKVKTHFKMTSTYE